MYSLCITLQCNLVNNELQRSIKNCCYQEFDSNISYYIYTLAIVLQCQGVLKLVRIYVRVGKCFVLQVFHCVCVTMNRTSSFSVHMVHCVVFLFTVLLSCVATAGVG